VGGPVVVVSAGGLYGLDSADGSILWQRPDIVAHEEVSPMIVGDTAYIGHRGANGSGAAMYAVNVVTGANVWPQPAPLTAGFEQQVTASADPDLGLLFVGLGLPPSPERTDTGPSVVVALRLEDGANAWLIPAAFPGSPPPTGLPIGWVGATGGTTEPQPALFVAAGSRVTALDARTGAALWVRPLPETELPPAPPDRRAVLLQPPVIASADPQVSTLFVGGASGRIYALDSNTGQDATGGLTTPVAPITGTLALAGNYLYLPTTTNLAALDVQAGTVVWESPLSAGSGVVVVGGSPYVGTMEGQFVGFSR
jgi:outer membrane protein assembly factor BamB